VKVILIMHYRLHETDRSPEFYLMDWPVERVVKFCCVSNLNRGGLLRELYCSCMLLLPS